jgi:hypothetical protein
LIGQTVDRHKPGAVTYAITNPIKATLIALFLPVRSPHFPHRPAVNAVKIPAKTVNIICIWAADACTSGSVKHVSGIAFFDKIEGSLVVSDCSQKSTVALLARCRTSQDNLVTICTRAARVSPRFKEINDDAHYMDIRIRHTASEATNAIGISQRG